MLQLSPMGESTMPRLFLIMIAFATGAGILVAAPARPLYQPEDPPKLPARAVQVNLVGTAWVGKYISINRIFTFEPDGTLSYKAASGKGKGFANRGTWRVVGDVLEFEHYTNPNQKLMHFRGTIKDGNTIVGEATFLLNNTKSAQTMTRFNPDLK
jgi:hypothetical protein